jgi:hypothetical protein
VGKLERDRGVGEDGEESIAIRLFDRTIDRAGALRELWADEELFGAKQHHAPNPARVLSLLRFIDECTYPHLLRNAHSRDHAKPTNFAVSWEAFSHAEFLLIDRLGDLGAPPLDEAETALFAGMVPKLEAQDARAQAVWDEDARILRLMVNGPELGGAA